MLKSCLDIQSNHVVSEMFNSIEIAITKNFKNTEERRYKR